MFFHHNLTGDRQSQSRSFAHAFGAKQMVKNSSSYVLRHTFAVVAGAGFDSI